MNHDGHYENHAADAPGRDDAGDPREPDDAAPLSPAVRRLVKAYDLDVSSIRGSGPSGRIRVGDVMAALGNSAEPAESDAAAIDDRPASAPAPASGPGPAESTDSFVAHAATDAAAEAAGRVPAFVIDAQAAAVPATTVFECDLGAVLAHRQREKGQGRDVSLTAYFAAAGAHALRHVPDLPEASGRVVRIAVHRLVDGRAEMRVLTDADALQLDELSSRIASAPPPETAPPAPIDDTADARGPEMSSTDETTPRAALTIRDLGAAGAVLAVPTPLDAGCAASLGIGKPRRQIVLRNVDGQETPRAGAACFLSLSYDPRRIGFAQANELLARVVTRIERWPQN